MSIEGQTFNFPGSEAEPSSLLNMAEQYRQAAEALRPLGRRRKPITFAPYRLLAIHAIELHLNALLRAAGYSAVTIRGFQHNMAKRTEAALAAGLVLKQRTIQHLRSLSETREYLVTRYDPALSSASELTRLKATLEEVAAKSAAIIGAAAKI